jgi:hypothetical protein
VHPDKQHPRRDHNLYTTLSDANTKAADAELSSRYVQRGFNVFRYNSCIVCHLPKLDLLYTIQIGMLDHLQKWNFHFINAHERLNKYNAIWLSLPAYHDLTPRNKSFEELSQWNGKEMKEMSWYLLGVVTHCWNSICMLDINLTMMKHEATWRTPCIVFTPSKMCSYWGEPVKGEYQSQ